MGAGRCFRAQNNENENDDHLVAEFARVQHHQSRVNQQQGQRSLRGSFTQQPGPGRLSAPYGRRVVDGLRGSHKAPQVPNLQMQELIRGAVASLGAEENGKVGKMEMDILRIISGQEDDSLEENECAICYEELHTAPVSVLCDAKNHRVCRHFYHTKCCELIQGSRIQNCPLCRAEFHHATQVPDPVRNPRGWFQAVDADGSMDLDKTEVVDALGAVFPVEPKALSKNLDLLWDRWDKTKSGSITLPEFVDPDQGLLQWVLANQYRLARKQQLSDGIPDIRRSRTAWFNYWDADGNAELDREEVMRALLKTFRHADVGVTRSIVGALWTDFDTDNGGTIDREEFMRPNIGLLDTILANLAPGPERN